MIGSNGARGRKVPISLIGLPSSSAITAETIRAADLSLAGPHPATGEIPGVIGANGAEPYSAADLTNRDLFAPADDDLVLDRNHDRALRTAEVIEKFPHCPLLVERFADRYGAVVTLGLADMAEPQRRIERGQPARQHRCLNTGDAPAITGDGYVRETCLPPDIE